MGRRGHIGQGAINCVETLLMHSKCVRKFPLAPMDVTKLYHCCEGESCSFCECCARNPIDIGWKTSSKDNLSDSNNAATFTKANEESAFIIEILLIVYDCCSCMATAYSCMGRVRFALINYYEYHNKVVK